VSSRDNMPYFFGSPRNAEVPVTPWRVAGTGTAADGGVITNFTGSAFGSDATKMKDIHTTGGRLIIPSRGFANLMVLPLIDLDGGSLTTMSIQVWGFDNLHQNDLVTAAQGEFDTNNVFLPNPTVHGSVRLGIPVNLGRIRVATPTGSSTPVIELGDHETLAVNTNPVSVAHPYASGVTYTLGKIEKYETHGLYAFVVYCSGFSVAGGTTPRWYLLAKLY